MAKITIDFFELAFLAETCIPPRPIARVMFWHRLINDIYYQLNDGERQNMFEWMQRSSSFDLNNEDCQWFFARFNPKNQFEVSCFHRGKAEAIQCFKRDDKYWTAINTSINQDYIKSVKSLYK